jgi:hypothetical protein
MSNDLSLERAIQALRAGDRETARFLLHQLTQAEPLKSDGWLWLAAAQDDLLQKRVCLQQALALNPTDQRAIAALNALSQQPGNQAAASVSNTFTPQSAAFPSNGDQPTDQTTPTTPTGRLAQPRFVATGVQARRAIPWPVVVLVGVLVIVIPLALWLLGQTQASQAWADLIVGYIALHHLTIARVITVEATTADVAQALPGSYSTQTSNR